MMEHPDVQLVSAQLFSEVEQDRGAEIESVPHCAVARKS